MNADQLTGTDIVSVASQAIFGKALITNVYRSVIVEAIVAASLPNWEWCSSDYSSYDFKKGQLRLEVKQTALRQTWSTSQFSKPSWDVAPRTGEWVNGNTWVAGIGRNADLYVLALHPVTSDDADHRDPLQWSFYVIASQDLPATKRIGLRIAGQLAAPVGCRELLCRVEEVAAAII